MKWCLQLRQEVSQNIGLIYSYRWAEGCEDDISNNTVKFRKYAPPCISPFKYRPPKLATQKNPPLNRPSKYKPPPPLPSGGLYLETALKYKVKHSKNSKFPTNYKVSSIDFETQISLSRLKPLKKGLWRILGFFSEFYGIGSIQLHLTMQHVRNERI